MKQALRHDIHILYLGDHDPSGIDMTRDVLERLEMFSECSIQVHRLALNMDQIDELNPPENPAKLTDSRASDYVKKYGESSWELDAIEPRRLAKIVRDCVLQLRDDDAYEAALKVQNDYRKELAAIANKFKS